MNPSQLFWAKLGDAVWPECYHPVICHLIDVAAVTSKIWHGGFRPRLRRWLAERLGLEEAACARWLAFWCGAHDIGKIAPCFQDRETGTAELRKRLSPHFDFPAGTEHHGKLGTKILADELIQATGWPALEKSIANKVAVAVGGHHGIFFNDWNQCAGSLGNERWGAARRETLTELARLCAVVGSSAPKIANLHDQSVWMCVAGLTSVADWIGSNQEFFPSVGNASATDQPLDVDRYSKEADKRAGKALETLGWLGRAQDNSTISFADLFPSITKARPLQTAVEEIVTRSKSPSLLIVEAPMGEGKTEAGWYAAACWGRQGGQGAYVALPTMATSNQMFERVTEFLEAEGGEGKKNLMLQHGKAVLNEQFDKLKYAARMYDQEKSPSAVVAEGWFAANKKHGLLAPFGVGTIDQALLAVMQTKHVFVRLFGLAGKCVILDEVHAYDAYMTTLMERLLRWLAALGCPVILLSATLPREKRLQLLRAYAGDEVAEPEPVDYPRVTSVAIGNSPAVRHVEADPSRKKTIELGWLNEESLAETLRQSLASGGCAAVIRNTVGLAQETYERLRETLKAAGIEIELFHARFPFGRRMQIEESVLERFGKNVETTQRNKRVLVATQVIEQSLDLDFDVMISDLAPVDLVLQRAGRLHRHERGTRPAGVRLPRIWLIAPEAEAGVPGFGPSKYVYDEHALLRSYLVLCGRITVQLPVDIDRMIGEAYCPKVPAAPPEWGDALSVTNEKRLAEELENIKAAGSFAIAEPVDEDDILERFNRGLQDDDDPRIPAGRRAMTRLTQHSVQVVFLYETSNTLALDPLGKRQIDITAKPNLAQIREILLNGATLSHQSVVWFYAKRDAPSGWQQTGILRYHRVIRLTPNGQAAKGEYPLVNSFELGVRFIRAEEASQ